MACTTDCHPPTPSQAHCGACHITMRTVTDFDRHRRDGQCLDPAAIGLVQVGRLWATPEGHRERERDVARLADARARARRSTQPSPAA